MQVARATLSIENSRLNELQVLMSPCDAIIEWRRIKNSATGKPCGRYPGYTQRGGFHEQKGCRSYFYHGHCCCWVGRHRERTKFTGECRPRHQPARRGRAHG